MFKTDNCNSQETEISILDKTEEIDKFHSYYVKALKLSYQKLVEFYAYNLRICLNGDDRKEFIKYLVLLFYYFYTVGKCPARDIIDSYTIQKIQYVEESKLNEKSKKFVLFSEGNKPYCYLF